MLAWGWGTLPPAGCQHAEGIWYEGPDLGELAEFSAKGRGGGGVPGLGLYLWKNPGSHTSRKVNVV